MKTHPDKRRSKTLTAAESLIGRQFVNYRQRGVAVRLIASPDLRQFRFCAAYERKEAGRNRISLGYLSLKRTLRDNREGCVLATRLESELSSVLILHSVSWEKSDQSGTA